MRKLLAEAAGTFALVAVICGASMMSFGAIEIDNRTLGIAIGAGICVAAMTFAFGRVSGGHFNPAVTCGLCAAGRFPARRVLPYFFAQVAGATLGALAIFIILSSQIGWSPRGFASNGFGAYSPGGYSAASAFAIEAVLSAVLVFVFCRAKSKMDGSAVTMPLAIGLTFAALYLFAMPVSNASLNPARSTATALFAESWAIGQLWMFWIAPVLGGIVGGMMDKVFASRSS